jgi:hypothetical protein
VNPEAAQESLRETAGCPKLPPDSTSYTSHWTPANTENPDQETVTYTHSSFHLYPLTNEMSLVLHKSPLKIATRKTHVNFMESVLCLVLII